MQRPFDLVEQIGDAVGVEARSPPSETTRAHAERRTPEGPNRHQSAAESVVDHVPKGTAGPPAFRLQLCGHIVVEGQGRSHILMLIPSHHDVQPAFPREDVH